MDFLKRYPIPIAGLILGLFALGNLVQSYSNEARHVIGVIGFILYVPYLLKQLYEETIIEECGQDRDTQRNFIGYRLNVNRSGSG